MVLQALSWSFYGLTTLIILFSVLYAEEHHQSGLLSSAGVIGLLSQVFMVSSLLTFQYNTTLYNTIDFSDAANLQLNKHRGHRATLVSLIDPTQAQNHRAEQQFGEYHTIVKQFLNMNLFLVLIGMVLSFIAEHCENDLKRYFVSILSLVCIIVAACLTHGETCLVCAVYCCKS